MLKFKAPIVVSALASILFSVIPLGSQAQSNYPDKPIRLIVPFPPGGTTDIVARLTGDRLSRELGQTVIIENRGGGGGAIGAMELARSKPDGYTLGIATVSTMAINPACNPKLGYDPVKSFVPITNLADTANVLVVHPSFPAKTFAEFLSVLKAHPDVYSFATSGNCGIAHLAGESLKAETGILMEHIPYRGSGPALNDVLAGQVPILIDNLPSSMPHIEAGKLRPLVVAWPTRLESMPNVPTYAEVGFPELNNPAWYGLIAPAGTPPEIVAKLYEATKKVLAQPDVKQAFAKQGAAPSGISPEAFAKQMAVELQRAKDIVKRQNIQLLE